MYPVSPPVPPDPTGREDPIPEPSSGPGGPAASGIPAAVLAEVFRLLPACAGLYDPSGTCVLASEALARWLARPLEEVVGRNVDQLWPGEVAAAVRARWSEALAGGGESVEELPRGGGPVPVRVVRRGWRDREGQPAWLVELFEEVGPRARMDTCGGLALGVARDQGNALAGVRCHLDRLEEVLEKDSPGWRRLADLRLALEQAGELAHQHLCLFSEGSPPAPTLVDLNVLLSSLEGLLRPRLGPQVRLRVEMAAGSAAVEGDPLQLTGVLLGLANQALGAMPDSGLLLLRCQAMSGVPGMPGVRGGPHVRLSVTDTGPGLTAEAQRQLFEPAGALGEVRERVLRHGGAIHCQSRRGQGTTFTVCLPARGSAAGTGAGPAVLVLDRSPEIRQLTGMILAHGRFTPLLCADLAEARQLCADRQPPIRLVVIDAGLCAGPRQEELEELLRRLPGARLLYTSAGDVVPALEGGAGLVLKPFRAEQFLRAVEGLVRKEGAVVH